MCRIYSVLSICSVLSTLVFCPYASVWVMLDPDVFNKQLYFVATSIDWPDMFLKMNAYRRFLKGSFTDKVRGVRNFVLY